MGRITQHPLRSKADAVVRALVMNGFVLTDDESTTEINDSAWSFALTERPGNARKTTIALEEDGRYSLRTNLLAARLDAMKASVPFKTCAVGRVYDGADHAVPVRRVVEGVVAEDGGNAKARERLWERVVQGVYGLRASARVTALDEATCRVDCTRDGATFAFARLGRASAMARTLLGLATSPADVWVYSIDVDALAMADCGIDDHAALYSPLVSFLDRFEDDAPAENAGFAGRAADILRAHGYREFFGAGLYEQDDYKKMNMIMESWDLNNRGALLQQPFGRFSRVPTVLTPSLQDALEANWKAGERDVRVFEIAHHYLLKKIGTEPVLKTSLSFGGFGGDLDRTTFRREVGAILDDLGVRNHYFIPTDMAIPYDPADCWVIMDENMRYLDGNFGSICRKARDAHGIEAPAFMAQIELSALERKSAEEDLFVPDEER